MIKCIFSYIDIRRDTMKKRYRTYFSKTTISIIFTIILGFLIGVFSTNTLPKTIYEIDDTQKSYVQIFLNAFSLNYWYFFVLWFLGMLPFGFCLAYFITFFKSFMIGVTFGLCLKSSAMFGILHFVTFAILEMGFLIPLLIYLASKSVSFSIFGRKSLQQNGQNYFNILVFITIAIVIYAILTCFKMNFLEVH